MKAAEMVARLAGGSAAKMAESTVVPMVEKRVVWWDNCWAEKLVGWMAGKTAGKLADR